MLFLDISNTLLRGSAAERYVMAASKGFSDVLRMIVVTFTKRLPSTKPVIISHELVNPIIRRSEVRVSKVVHPSFMELINVARERGIPVYLLSMEPRESVKRLAEELGVRGLKVYTLKEKKKYLQGLSKRGYEVVVFDDWLLNTPREALAYLAGKLAEALKDGDWRKVKAIARLTRRLARI